MYLVLTLQVPPVVKFIHLFYYNICIMDSIGYEGLIKCVFPVYFNLVAHIPFDYFCSVFFETCGF